VRKPIDLPVWLVSLGPILGAAAALAWKDPAATASTDLYSELTRLWGKEDAQLAQPLRTAWRRFCAWRERARPNLMRFWSENL
jgi:hypothetical protein